MNAPVRLTTILLAAAIGAACGDQPTPTGLAPEPLLAIVDASSGGNKHFFFLAPIRQGAPSFSGRLDATLSPEVLLRENGTVIARLDASLTDERMYRAVLDTKDYGLDPAEAYQLSVVIGGRALGFADLDVLDNGSGIRNALTNDDVPLVDGRVLAVNFRIEDGWCGQARMAVGLRVSQAAISFVSSLTFHSTPHGKQGLICIG